MRILGSKQCRSVDTIQMAPLKPAIKFQSVFTTNFIKISTTEHIDSLSKMGKFIVKMNEVSEILHATADMLEILR